MISPFFLCSHRPSCSALVWGPPLLLNLSPISVHCPDRRGWKEPLIQAHLLSCAGERGSADSAVVCGEYLPQLGCAGRSPQSETVVYFPKGVGSGLWGTPKPLSLPGRRGWWPTATYNLAVFAISGTEIIAVPCLLPQAPHLTVSGATDHSWLAPLPHSLGQDPLFCECMESRPGVRAFLGERLFLTEPEVSASPVLCQPPQNILTSVSPSPLSEARLPEAWASTPRSLLLWADVSSWAAS